jgi:hypothetical protein
MDRAAANFVRPILGVVPIQFVEGRRKSATCLGSLSAARMLPEFNPSIRDESSNAHYDPFTQQFLDFEIS